MNRKFKTIFCLIALTASLYTAHHAIIWGRSMLEDGRKRISCAWLSQQMLIADFESFSTSKMTARAEDYTRVLNSICWKKKEDKSKKDLASVSRP